MKQTFMSTNPDITTYKVYYRDKIYVTAISGAGTCTRISIWHEGKLLAEQIYDFSIFPSCILKTEYLRDEIMKFIKVHALKPVEFYK